MLKFQILLTAIFLSALAIVMVPHTLNAQTGSTLTKAQVTAVLPQLEQFIQDDLKRTGVPGVSVGIVFQDEVVYLKGFGVREAGKPALVDADTAFQLASVSKPLGSTVISSLINDGLVSWDSKISDLDPSFRLMDAFPTSELTVRDLYAHRSGLPGQAGTELEIFGYDRAEILHVLRYVKPSGSFRAGYSYSDFGMTEGAEAAVKPTGKTWQEVSQERLYTPLGMTHTTSLDADFLKETNRAELHAIIDGKYTHVIPRQPDAQSPAGGASSSARDMSEWMRLELANGKYNGKQLIKPEVMAQAHVPVMNAGPNPVTGLPRFYGQGWNNDLDRGRIMWDHAGAFTHGAHTLIRMSPSENLGIVVLSNAFPSGIPEATAYTFYDLVRDGKPSRDWGVFWENQWNGIYGPQVLAQLAAPFAKPPANATPALANAAYVGKYGNAYIPDVEIVEKNDSLVLLLGPDKMEFPLTHFDRDTFLFVPSLETPQVPSPIFAEIGTDGKASQLILQVVLDTGADGVVKRIADAP